MFHGVKCTLHGVKRISHGVIRTLRAVGYTLERGLTTFSIAYRISFIIGRQVIFMIYDSVCLKQLIVLHL